MIDLPLSVISLLSSVKKSLPHLFRSDIIEYILKNYFTDFTFPPITKKNLVNRGTK
jgi:hypothetical protein